MDGDRSESTSSLKPQCLPMRAPSLPYTLNDFIRIRLLGVGSYSEVLQVKKKDTGEEFALKVMNKRHVIREKKINNVKMERMILDHLDHPGIVKLCFTFQDAHSLYMGLECCHGGELFDQIGKKGQLSLEEAKFYAAELVEILEYIHGKGLIHRDLKPENVLLMLDGHLKLVDFGGAKATMPPLSELNFSEGDNASNLVGTAEYVSPEALKGSRVTIGADLWALGCILYHMLVGVPPFRGASEYLTFQKVMQGEFLMPSHVSSEAKELINGLLDMEPEKRPGAGMEGYAALRGHPFFNGIDWMQLRKSPAPKFLLPEIEFGGENGYSGSGSSDWEFSELGDGFSKMGIKDTAM